MKHLIMDLGPASIKREGKVYYPVRVLLDKPPSQQTLMLDEGRGFFFFGKDSAYYFVPQDAVQPRVNTAFYDTPRVSVRGGYEVFPQAFDRAST